MAFSAMKLVSPWFSPDSDVISDSASFGSNGGRTPKRWIQKFVCFLLLLLGICWDKFVMRRKTCMKLKTWKSGRRRRFELFRKPAPDRSIAWGMGTNSSLRSSKVWVLRFILSSAQLPSNLLLSTLQSYTTQYESLHLVETIHIQASIEWFKRLAPYWDTRYVLQPCVAIELSMRRQDVAGLAMGAHEKPETQQQTNWRDVLDSKAPKPLSFAENASFCRMVSLVRMDVLYIEKAINPRFGTSSDHCR